MKDNKKLNSLQRDEHFASLSAGCASQGTMKSDTKAGNQIIIFHL